MLHKSVLLNESINSLNIKKNGIYVDATLGYAGHASKILELIPDGYLYGIDQDDYAIEKSDELLKKIADNYHIIRSNFSNMKEELQKQNVTKVDGILFDLGVSSVQLDFDERGFSFHKNAKLDMRMNTNQKLSAYDVVNEYDYKELVRILRDYGEEKYATSIAKNIINERNKKPIETTLELVEIIKKSMPISAMREHHPARKSFQAIRIEVNNELEVLKEGLEQAIELINVGGRISVISFHSLEDKIVKNTFNKYCEIPDSIKKLPYIPNEYKPKFKIITKGITASDKELEENNRARSARLRVIERISD